MNFVFRDKVKWNSFTRDEVDSDYFTTFTQNFSDTPANTNKNYTNLINAKFAWFRSKKTQENTKPTKTMLWI